WRNAVSRSSSTRSDPCRVASSRICWRDALPGAALASPWRYGATTTAATSRPCRAKALRAPGAPVVHRGVAVTDDGRAVGREVVNEGPAIRCPEVGALAADDELIEAAVAGGGSGQHAGGAPAERRAVGQLRIASHLLQRRAGRVPRAPAKPPGSSPGYALTD